MVCCKKVPDDLENPLDNLLYDTSDVLVDKLHALKFVTPNVITSVGLVFGLISIYLLIKGNWLGSITFLWLYYFSDCLDGHYARKYDGVTVFGDYYDHFRDWTISLMIACLLFYRLKTGKSRLIFVIVLIILIFLSGVYLGCQERIGEIYDFRAVSPTESSPSLQSFKRLCPNATQTIKFAKLFSPNTVIMLFSFYIWYTSKHIE
jgi:phosphatidylglycerophosphate synthase